METNNLWGGFGPDQSFAEARSNICDAALVSFSILALPALVFTLYRSVDIGWHPMMALHVACTLILWSITAARRHIPYSLRAGIPILLLIMLGLSGLWNLGFAGAAAIPMLVLAPIMTVVFLGPRMSYISLGVVIAGSVLIAAHNVSGHRLPPFDVEQYITSWPAWALVLVVLVMSSVSVTLALGRLTRYLTDTSRIFTRQARLLRSMVEGTSSGTGADFFDQLARSLSEGLGTSNVLVGELVPGSSTRVRTISVWSDGKIIENFEYEVTGTPCAEVFEAGSCCYPDHVLDYYPDDQMLLDLGVVSYAGVSLVSSDGKLLGLLATVDRQPMADEDMVRMILSVFSTRASAELERLQIQQRARQQEQRLTFALEAIDSGFALYDSDDRLVMCNQTYRKTFRSAGSRIKIGMRFDDVLRLGLDEGLYPQARGREEDWLAERKHRHGDYTMEQPLSGNRWERLSEYTTSNGERVRVFSDITVQKLAEQTLRASEEKYRGIFDESVASIFVCDTQNKFIDSNQAGLEMLGYERSELLGLSMADTMSGTEAGKLAHQQELGGGRTINFEHQMIRKDGRIITVLNNSRPLSDAEGRVIGTQSTLLDITDRKRAEKELYESNRILREAQRIGHLGNWIWDVNTNEVVWSEQIYHIFGVGVDDFTPSFSSFLSCIHPDDRDEVNAAVMQACLSGQYSSIHRILLPDGRISHVYDRGEMEFDENGQPLRMAGTVLDITEQKQAELALRKSEQEFRTILNNTSDLITVLSETGEIIFQSRSSEKVLGYRPEELVGRNCMEFIHPDDVDDIRERLADMARSPTSEARAEFRFRHRDKSWKTLSSLGSFIPPGTDYQGILVNTRDVTRHKLMEQAVQRSESMLTTAIESTDEGFILFDPDERFVLCNSTYREMFSEVGDLLVPGTRLVDILQAIAEQEMFEGTQTGEEAWVAERLAIYRCGSSREELRLSNGKWFKVSLRLMPDGSTVGVLVDITELKQAEENARLAQIRFQDYAETASDWFWETGPDLRFSYVSRVRGVIANRRSEIIGKNRLEWIREHNAPEIAARYEAILRDHKPFRNFEYQFRHANGKLHFTQISGNPHFSQDGEFLGYRGTGRDITNQKMLVMNQAQTQKMEALGRLTGSIAHDFNNTLQPISLLSSAMLKGMDEDNPVYRNIAIIDDAVAQLSSLTRRITQFSRQDDVEKELVDISAMVREAIALARIGLPENVRLIDSLDEPCGEIPAIAAELQSVVLNLITNAVDACEDKGGEITVSLGRIDNSADGEGQGGQMIKLTVADTGSGISDDNLPYIFEPFFSTKTSGKGIGLGLSSAYGIVTGNHGGRIEVTSKPGQGAVFEIFLPTDEMSKNIRNRLQETRSNGSLTA